MAPFIIITKDDDDGKYDEMWEKNFRSNEIKISGWLYPMLKNDWSKPIEKLRTI